jgi:hypothetical protein
MRAVSPWTWRRALRDHGPQSPGVLLTLYTIGTFMNRDGIAWPSQEAIASGARASVRTVQRHIAAALRAGWLGVELAGRNGQGWRHNAYRCAVPEDLSLDCLDESIADAIIAQNGDIIVPERDDTMLSSASRKGHDTMLSSPVLQRDERDDNGGRKVTTSDTEGDDTGDQTWRHNSGVLTPALNSHRTPAPEKAHSASAVRATTSESATAPESRERFSPEPDSAARHRILRLATAQSHLPDVDIARISHASVDLVREVRGSMGVQR